MTNLQTNGVPSSELESIQSAYHILQQRDGSAERRAWHWQVTAWIAIIGLIGLGVWDHLDRRADLKPVIQSIQVDDAGKVVHVGEPQDLMAYTPQEGHWHDLLTRWVVSVRWRSGEPVVTKRDWGWAYVHTCGGARQLLNTIEAREKPFAATKRQVSVEVEAITKSPAPQNYQVLWAETIVDPALPVKDTQRYLGTFVVSRYMPPSESALKQNPLGLCLSAFDLTRQP